MKATPAEPARPGIPSAGAAADERHALGLGLGLGLGLVLGLGLGAAAAGRHAVCAALRGPESAGRAPMLRMSVTSPVSRSTMRNCAGMAGPMGTPPPPSSRRSVTTPVSRSTTRNLARARVCVWDGRS